MMERGSATVEHDVADKKHDKKYILSNASATW